MGLGFRFFPALRLAGVALVAAVLQLAPACARPAADGGHITLGLQLEPPSLDPTSGPAAAIRDVSFRTVFEGLVKLGPGGVVAPSLADRWKVSADGLTYDFDLHPGVRFHDGAPMDALAVKFSFDRARAKASTNGQKSLFARIDHVETPDPLHVRIVLKDRFSGLLQLLGWGDAVIVSPATAAANAAHPVGTGPFRFVGWRRGDSVSLERNPDYWGRPPSLAGVTFRFISDPSAASAALSAGDVDGFPAFPAPENLKALQTDRKFTVFTGASEAKTLMAMNNQKPPFNNLKVRQALSYAVDRQAVIDSAMFGYGRPIGSHFPPSDQGYVDLTRAYPHDPARARALLAEAGYPNGFTTSIALPPLPYARRSGEVIAAQLAEVGVTARLENLEWAQWLDRVFGRHDYDMTVVAHVEPMDLGIYARDDYYFGYRNPAYHALMQRLDRAVTEPERLAAIGDAQRMLSADAVNVWLFEFPAIGVFRKDLTDIWSPTPVGAIDLTSARLNGVNGAGAAVSRGEHAPVAIWWGLGLMLAALTALAAQRAGPRWLAGRLLGLTATLAAATVVVFLMLEIAPGDPARFMMGLNADPSALAALRHQLGLDATPLHRYLSWIGGLMQGDLGTSYTYRAPVSDLVAERLAVTLPLTLMALILSSLFALVAALASMMKPGGLLDRAIGVFSALGVAIPSFWLGLMLVVVFATLLHWTSAGGFPGWSGGVWPAVKALLLPAIALAAPQGAIMTRVLRGALFETLSEDYIRTARAKGLSRTAALIRHALPNALLPALTLVGLQFGFLLAGAVIVENTFFLPGLGRLVFQAVEQRDLIVVQSVVVILVFAVTLAAFVVDLAAASIDPRLRDASRGGRGA